MSTNEIVTMIISVISLTISILLGFKVFERCQRNNAKNVVAWLNIQEYGKSNSSKIIIHNTTKYFAIYDCKVFVKINDTKPIYNGYVDLIEPEKKFEMCISSNISRCLPKNKITSEMSMAFGAKNDFEIIIIFNTSPKKRWIKSSYGKCKFASKKNILKLGLEGSDVP